MSGKCEECKKPIRFWQTTYKDKKIIDSPVDSRKALSIEIKYHIDCYENKFFPNLKKIRER